MRRQASRTSGKIAPIASLSRTPQGSLCPRLPGCAIVQQVTEPFSIETIRTRLRGHRAVAQESATRASVAMILGPKNDELCLLFIKRAEHPKDPWSGHMALPGGRRDSADGDDLRTALRETREEVGIDLSEVAELLGPLDHVKASARGRPIDMAIAPFVFYVKTLTPIVPSSEVVSAYWVPLRPLFDGSANTQVTVNHPDGIVTLPAWSVAGNHVWGLTYRMVQGLFSLISPARSQVTPCM